MLTHLGFTLDVVGYVTRDAGIRSLEEIDYLYGDDVEIRIKRLNRPGARRAHHCWNMHREPSC
jgi:hypothetical protein